MPRVVDVVGHHFLAVGDWACRAAGAHKRTDEDVGHSCDHVGVEARRFQHQPGHAVACDRLELVLSARAHYQDVLRENHLDVKDDSLVHEDRDDADSTGEGLLGVVAMNDVALVHLRVGRNLARSCCNRLDHCQHYKRQMSVPKKREAIGDVFSALKGVIAVKTH